MKKNLIILIMGILLLSSCVFAKEVEIGTNNKIKFLDSTFDTVPSNDVFLSNEIISFRSENYLTEVNKVTLIEYETISEAYNCNVVDHLNGTIEEICQYKDKVVSVNKDKVAELTFSGCESGKWYRIYKNDLYSTNKYFIKNNGYVYDEVQCVDSNLNFYVDSFSSYTIEELTELAVGLVSYYSFDTDGSDEYGTKDLTNNGASFVSGALNNGADFEFSESDYMVSATSTLNGFTSYTICAWVTRESATTWNAVWGEGVAGNYFGGSSASLIRNRQNTGALSDLDAPNTLPANTAYNYVCQWYDGTNQRTYVNGTQKATKGDTGTVSSVGLFTVGAWDTTGGYYDGIIDEMAVWDRALNTTEMTKMYNSGTAFNLVEELNAVVGITSYFANPLAPPDFTFATSTYTTIASIGFNTTAIATDMGVLSSFNLEKLTGSGTSDIYLRILLDGTNVVEELVRSISAKNQIGATGIKPFSFNVTNGAHNLTIDIRRTGNGDIEFSNAHFALGKFLSTGNESTRGNVTEINVSFQSTTPVVVFNKTVQKDFNATTFLTSKLNFRSDTLTDTAICHWEDGGRSADIVSEVAGSGLTVALATTYLTEPENSTDYLKLICYSEDNQEIFIQGSLMEIDLKDDFGTLIPHNQYSNPLTNYTNKVNITGTTLLGNISFTLQNGTGIFISTSGSFRSVSGDQIPTARVTVNSSTGEAVCVFEQQRFTGGAIGNQFFYSVCDNMTTGLNYTLNGYAVVPVGETLEFIDGSLSYMEITEFDVTVRNTQPVVLILNPFPLENIYGNYTFKWSVFDLQNDNVTSTINITQGGTSFLLAEDLVSKQQTFDLSNLTIGTYTVEVTSCENSTPELLCGSSFVLFNVIVPEEVSPEFLQTLTCPETTSGTFIVWFFVAFFMALFVIGISIGETVLSLLGGVGIVFASFSLMGCSIAMGMIIFATGLIMAILSLTIKV